MIYRVGDLLNEDRLALVRNARRKPFARFRSLATTPSSTVLPQLPNSVIVVTPAMMHSY
jgi:hypothetical protein